jgi:hypothetical protein
VIFKFGPNRFHQISKKKTAAFLNPSTEARAAGINKIAGRGIWGNPRLCFIHRDHEWCKAKHRRIARRTQNDACVTVPIPPSALHHLALLAHSHTHGHRERRGRESAACSGHRPHDYNKNADPAYAAQATASAFPSHLYRFRGRVCRMRRRPRSARDGFLPLPPRFSFAAVLTFSERALGFPAFILHGLASVGPECRSSLPFFLPRFATVVHSTA